MNGVSVQSKPGRQEFNVLDLTSSLFLFRKVTMSERNSEFSVLGYSERGMINAICDDILHAKDSRKALESFLSWCVFPNEAIQPDFSHIATAKILVEQSFSDFGDLDLLFLLEDHTQRRQAVLLEAKVCTATSAWKGCIPILRIKKSRFFRALPRQLLCVQALTLIA